MKHENGFNQSFNQSVCLSNMWQPEDWITGYYYRQLLRLRVMNMSKLKIKLKFELSVGAGE